MRLIDADALLPELENIFKAAGAISSCNHELWVGLASDVIARAPTIDPHQEDMDLKVGLPTDTKPDDPTLEPPEETRGTRGESLEFRVAALEERMERMMEEWK